MRDKGGPSAWEGCGGLWRRACRRRGSVGEESCGGRESIGGDGV